LFYDAPEPKPVVTHKEKAFEFMMYTGDNGKSGSVQFRIHVLSTQNQGMLFKIRVRLTVGQRFLELWTDSIKVVAKLDSIRKKMAEREGSSIAPRKNKRARADDLLDSLASIQEQQKQHGELLNTLLYRMGSHPVSPSHSPYAFSSSAASSSSNLTTTFLPIPGKILRS